MTSQKQQVRPVLAVIMLLVLLIFTSARTSPTLPTFRDAHGVSAGLMKQRQFVAEPISISPLLVFVGILIVVERRKLVLAPVPVPTQLAWDRDYNRPPPTA